jgi:hypothetical protein
MTYFFENVFPGFSLLLLFKVPPYTLSGLEFESRFGNARKNKIFNARH